MKKSDNKNIYKVLSYIYDDLMSDINYDEWADFIDEVIQTHHENGVSLLELGCGTGTFALSLEEFDYYDITASDFSEEMLELAKTKSVFKQSSVQWRKIDFYDLPSDLGTFDIIVMLFDTMNYVQSGTEITALLKNLRSHLNRNGIIIFDFTTPRNSIEAEVDLNEEGARHGFHYVRKSFYLKSERIHYNEFEIEQIDDEGEVVDTFSEIHRQKIYTLQEMKEYIQNANFDFLAAYEGFDLVDANDNSDRITMVIQ